MILGGYICEYLIDTCCIPPQAVFSTASPNKAAALHCTAPCASSPTQSITFLLCTVIHHAIPFSFQISSAFSHPIHTAPTLHSTSPAPQCQSLCSLRHPTHHQGTPHIIELPSSSTRWELEQVAGSNTAQDRER